MRTRGRPAPTFTFVLPDHPSQHALRDMAQAAADLGLRVHQRRQTHWRRQIGRISWYGYPISRLLARVGPLTIAPLMGPQRNAAAEMMLTRALVPYVFDCWPGNYNVWDRELDLIRPEVCAFTARAAAERYEKRLPGVTVLWLPEGIHEGRLHLGRPLTERSINVLELGRRHAEYHRSISTALHALGHSHLYERAQGEIIFPDDDGFRRGLLDSQVVVCFPLSRTHPERAGSTATITQRYLESIASGCLIVGESPQELIDVFGYDPVVTVDWHAPAQHLIEVLATLSDYQDVVERNFHRLRETSLWSDRLRRLVRAIDQSFERA